ncbi:hypothetical protein AKI39_21090 [Bordetella sp. H567]|uniref:hypothetical protein n=1 Tax=Bordetella sp. H567 TaxID=1697043 RepID=UPI00081C4BC4|nr:hypothetical protein [Bordetella sp. H567]AOB32702.1 hypothetical protein AKI39_21090 [Bordetella sp. H567]
MTPERFRTIVEAYGAESRRWPEAERASALSWASAHPTEADAIVAEAAPLDAWLDSRAVAPPARAVFDRIVASAPVRHSFWRRWRLWWSSAVFAGVGVAGGFVGAFAVSLFLVTAAVPPAHHDAPWLDTGFGEPLSDWSEE